MAEPAMYFHLMASVGRRCLRPRCREWRGGGLEEGLLAGLEFPELVGVGVGRRRRGWGRCSRGIGRRGDGGDDDDGEDDEFRT